MTSILIAGCGYVGQRLAAELFNLETAVGSRKAVEYSGHKLHFLHPWRSSTQALGAPGKSEKPLITNKVTTSFSDLPCTPIAYASFSRLTAVSRFNHGDAESIHGLVASDKSRRLLEGWLSSVSRIDLDTENPPDIEALPAVEQIYYFIPPPSKGIEDTRLPRFLQGLGNNFPQRVVMISTSGVYGNCHGEWVDESRPVSPQADRAKRRYDAEQQMTVWGRQQGVDVMILRVAGIYGPGRLPVARLEKKLPMVDESEAPWTNRIHVDDLITVCKAVMANGGGGEVYNVSDGNPGNMTDYFNQVADIAGLPRPPVIKLDEADGRLSAGLMSYLRESRRIDNRKMLAVPGVDLRYPTLAEGLPASVGV